MRKQHSVIQNKHMEKLRHKRWRRIASVLMAAVVFCTTYALILPAITMERTETHRQDNGVPESLTFSYADEGITGTITLPWSEELPEDLHCSVTKLDGTEDNYDALYQSASETFAAEEKVLSAIQIYQLHWQSAGEPYTLPQDSQPTVQLTAAAENEGKEPLTGLAFTEEPADNASDDSPAQAPGKELRAAQPAPEATTDAEETAAEPRYTAVPLEHDHIALGPSGLFAWARASAAAVGGHYYKRVDSIQEIQQAYRAGYPEKYVILYANSVQQALGTDQWYTAPMVVQPVKGYGNEGYFELSYVYADGADGHFGYRGWQERSNPFDYKDRHWQIRPHPSNSSAFYIWANETWSDELWTSISDSNRIYLDHDDATNTWRIHGASYYMSYDEKTNTPRNITDTSYLPQCNMLLFRYVGGEREIVDDISGSEEVSDQLPDPWTKPAYDDYRPVSQAKEGKIAEVHCPIPDATMTYASDPATANIEGKLGSKTKAQEGEDLYRLQEENDGRILTDKSVVYSADDYDAAQVAGYGAYETGDFSVSLSALGQEWMVTDTVSTPPPVDVVYVLDISSSMNRQDSNGPRWRAAMESINLSMKSVLEQNAQNRVGLVTFSNTSQQVLPLDRYSPNRNGDFLEASQQSFSYSILLNSLMRRNMGRTTMDYIDSCNIQTAQGLRYAGDSDAAIHSAGTVPVTQFGFSGSWDKTYTQLGLQEAYDTFLSLAESSSEHLTFSVEGKTYARRPVIILVTDGDPTICTYNYMYPKAGPSYGQGESQGVAGYYTLLSANYFKNLTSILYQKTAGFFTIGIHCTDPYTKAVLEPTYQRVAASVSGSSSVRGQQLYNLLENIGPGYGASGGRFTQIVKGQSAWMHYFLDMPGLGYNSPCIRGMTNPYGGNYNYCDKAWFEVLTEEDMNEAFSEILKQIQITNNYKFLLKENTDLVITDHIGEGFRLKGTPVLRFFGKNYAPDPSPVTGIDADGTPYTLYRWSQTATRQPSDAKAPEGTALSLHGIRAKVTSENGRQTVTFTVPENAMPTYYPDLYKCFYYEELPVRLIYRVGLSQEELADLQSVSGAIPERRYYTSLYDQETKEALTSVRFTPDESNPYYADALGDVVPKTANVSATSDYSALEYVENGQVVQLLGNNGTLTIQREDFLNLVVQKQWMPGTAPAEQIRVALYASGIKRTSGAEEIPGVWEVAVVQLDEASNWRYEWHKFPKQQTREGDVYTYTDFFLREVDPADYSVTYQDGTGAVLVPMRLQIDNAAGDALVNAVPVPDGTVTIVNARPYTLPYTGGSGGNGLPMLGILLSGSACIVQILRRSGPRCQDKEVTSGEP